MVSSVQSGLGHSTCSIQMVRNSRENFRDILGIVLLQLVLVVAEDLGVL